MKVYLTTVRQSLIAGNCVYFGEYGKSEIRVFIKILGDRFGMTKTIHKMSNAFTHNWPETQACECLTLLSSIRNKILGAKQTHRKTPE